MDQPVFTPPPPAEPVLIPAEAYISEAYARAENEKLWAKVWQWACRVEEIPKVGDFVTYDILDESIIVTRASKDEIRAYYNVCQHRGRRLTAGKGCTKRFHCPFHGWQWNLDGTNARVVDKHDWNGQLTDDRLALRPVKVDIWGGYVFINMDPDCEPLHDYLEPAKSMLDPFEIDRMRFRWRKATVMPCNWKTALEAFNESYHLQTSHPQLLEWSDDLHWSKAWGKHSNSGMMPFPANRFAGQGSKRIKPEPLEDVREALAVNQQHLVDTLDAFLSHSMVEAAQRLPKELPEGTPPLEVLQKMVEWTIEIDAKKGVTWPAITPQHMLDAGYDWHIFPNCLILAAPTYVLGYRTRPNGYDPDSCIFEAYAMDRVPEGTEPPQPEIEWSMDLTDERFWGLILMQDIHNMPEVQRGMKSRGFVGARPNPVWEQAVSNFHKTLADYMGTGAPVVEPVGETPAG
ncbi:SRPBCC family protein [uncultured Sphingomonas sp.]|uniref:aromatic ring-hydroxylating oxygenase subunit alpha n=1 Tax=uncultured Sphingomonas sp. TaxID=158754 RepID=UPI0035CB54F6